MGLIDLDTVKDWLGIAETVTKHDELLQGLIDRGGEIIERELRWYFGAPRDAVEVLDGTGTSKLFLRQYPVDESAVVVETRSGVSDDWTAVDGDDFEVDGRGLHHRTKWLRGRRNHRATYQEGFDDVPGDIRQLLLDLVSIGWRRRGKEGLSGERIGDYSYTLLPGTGGDIESLPRWKAVVSRWKRLRL